MKYSISTIPIYDRFNSTSLCALCDIEYTTNKQLIDQFLDEAVMEDHVRAKVNKLGFCKYHYDKLYEGQSKLGLALQSSTRLTTIFNAIKPIDNLKQAKKQVEELEKLTCNCTICEILDDHMARYEETVAKMFLAEEDFRNILPKEKSICLPHYINLLKQSAKAGKYADQFIKTINEITRNSTNILSSEIRKFCTMFDYRNKGKPMGEERLSLQKNRIKLYGKK